MGCQLDEVADVFGRMVEGFCRGRLAERPVYRRDDGRVSEAHLEGYFAGYDEWSELDRGRSTTSRDQFSTPAVGSAELWTQAQGIRRSGSTAAPARFGSHAAGDSPAP